MCPVCHPPVLLCLILLLLLAARVGAAQEIGAPSPQDSPSLTARVDSLFAAWDKRDTPGCALAVVQDGKIIYKRGYGMANLEYGIRNTPATIFHVASVSKQFTAFAIHLLAQEGKLSLDDDARKYLPELHDFGKTITIRHLLHHTSGLRDQWDLLRLAGWRMADVITEQDILGLVWRQRELNFDPGTEYLYCNTGYTLLGQIVERVSGKSLREFTQERIFQPLGMKHTHFHDDYRMLVKNRAYSYEPKSGGGYQRSVLSFSNVGATSLFTTVEDLARWDQNFYKGRVGGQAVLAAMQQKGHLNNGAELDYASGLVLGDYRGLKVVEHNGADAGYRADLLRFPDQKFSIIVLANTAEFDSSDMARKVADIYLQDRLKPVPESIQAPSAAEPSEAAPPVLTPEQMQEFTGEYYSAELGVLYTVTVHEGSLRLRYPRGDMRLQMTLPDTFAAPEDSLFQSLRYTRSPDEAITGFTITTGRVRNLRFVKAEIRPVSKPTQ